MWFISVPTPAEIKRHQERILVHPTWSIENYTRYRGGARYSVVKPLLSRHFGDEKPTYVGFWEHCSCKLLEVSLKSVKNWGSSLRKLFDKEQPCNHTATLTHPRGFPWPYISQLGHLISINMASNDYPAENPRENPDTPFKCTQIVLGYKTLRLFALNTVHTCAQNYQVKISSFL